MAKSPVLGCEAVLVLLAAIGSLRPDGTSVLDVRATLELEDGALIDASYGGPADLDPDGCQRFLVGNPPAPVASPSHRDITPVMQRISG